MSARQLRARLDRLTPPATGMIGQDRDRDRRRREELRGRKPTGLTELETVEYMKLDALFREEDRDHDRLLELSFKQFYAEIGRDQLTEEEVHELDSLNLRYPPDPNDPLAPAWEFFRAELAKSGHREGENRNAKPPGAPELSA
jgi:hypothetical protein